MLNEYKVHVLEAVKRTKYIEANSLEEAEEIAENYAEWEISDYDETIDYDDEIEVELW